ncbi:MAG TPA: FAD-dependent monooxygenase, partial [Phycisphaerae bacterium]|nr:FAD-dependent monooxygenase [Phycisphaerae bacterium]
MSTPDVPLIVGAGPVGLGAALFLADQEIPTRIVDQAAAPSTHSKALAINPRTLEILEPSGVTARLLELGRRIRGAKVWREGALAAEINFAALEHRYPFMLALSQATTERLIAEAVKQRGLRVERGVRLVECRNANSHVTAALAHSEDEFETVHCPWMLAADGAHSTARDRLNVPFPGSTLADPWHLADVPLATSLAEDYAHIVLVDGGFLFMMRVIEPADTDDTAVPLWRVLGNQPHPLTRLVADRVAGPPIWESHFRISHRIVRAMSVGRIHFAGDAAHLHSPMGARGMNLGLEDAWVFAQLAGRDALERYHAFRRPVSWAKT